MACGSGSPSPMKLRWEGIKSVEWIGLDMDRISGEYQISSDSQDKKEINEEQAGAEDRMNESDNLIWVLAF